MDQDQRVTSSPVPQPERPPSPMKPPSKGAIAFAVGGGVVVVGGLLTLLWVLVDGNSVQASIQLELVRIALTILLGTGGLFGLYLAWRRQRSTEIALQQKERDQADVARAYALQERSAMASEADAAARRITELYTKAVEQLGSDKAPVRLGGLYALERLAQDNPDQRQTIVNVLCAYLRMAYNAPKDEAPNAETERDAWKEHQALVQERTVRLAAQDLLAKHLRRGGCDGHFPPAFWDGIDLDLTGATLINFLLEYCTVRSATFESATFIGRTGFRATTFAHSTSFHAATFTGDADFSSSNFTTLTNFGKANFSGLTTFRGTNFCDAVIFGSATFFGRAVFRETSFSGITIFRLAAFAGKTDFFSATFPDPPTTIDFTSTTFTNGTPQQVAQVQARQG